MTSPDHNDSRKLLQIIGQVDIFEDSTAGDTVVSVLTADGDEYVIASRKIVKRLLRYAGEEIDIEFLGYITHDASDGLDILNVVSFKPTSEEDIKTTADYDRGLGSKKRKKAIDHELDDEDMDSEDFDISIINDDDLDDLDLDDEELDLDDEDFDLGDADIDLSILNDIVKEVIGKIALEPTEPAEEADATPEHDRQTKNAEGKTADKPNKAPGAKKPDKTGAKKDAKPAQKKKTPPPSTK